MSIYTSSAKAMMCKNSGILGQIMSVIIKVISDYVFTIKYQHLFKKKKKRLFPLQNVPEIVNINCIQPWPLHIHSFNVLCEKW